MYLLVQGTLVSVKTKEEGSDMWEKKKKNNVIDPDGHSTMYPHYPRW